MPDVEVPVAEALTAAVTCAHDRREGAGRSSSRMPADLAGAVIERDRAFATGVDAELGDQRIGEVRTVSDAA